MLRRHADAPAERYDQECTRFLAKWFRDIEVFDIVEGTGQIQRIVISKRIYEGLKGF